MNPLKWLRIFLLIGSLFTTVTAYGASAEIEVSGQIGENQQIEIPTIKVPEAEPRDLAEPKETVVELSSLPKAGENLQPSLTLLGLLWLAMCVFLIYYRWSNHQIVK